MELTKARGTRNTKNNGECLRRCPAESVKEEFCVFVCVCNQGEDKREQLGVSSYVNEREERLRQLSG